MVTWVQDFVNTYYSKTGRYPMIYIIPDTPERPATPVQRKRTHTLVGRTPAKPPTSGRLVPAVTFT